MLDFHNNKGPEDNITIDQLNNNTDISSKIIEVKNIFNKIKDDDFLDTLSNNSKKKLIEKWLGVDKEQIDKDINNGGVIDSQIYELLDKLNSKDASEQEVVKSTINLLEDFKIELNQVIDKKGIDDNEVYSKLRDIKKEKIDSLYLKHFNKFNKKSFEYKNNLKGELINKKAEAIKNYNTNKLIKLKKGAIEKYIEYDSFKHDLKRVKTINTSDFDDYNISLFDTYIDSLNRSFQFCNDDIAYANEELDEIRLEANVFVDAPESKHIEFIGENELNFSEYDIYLNKIKELKILLDNYEQQEKIEEKLLEIDKYVIEVINPYIENLNIKVNLNNTGNKMKLVDDKKEQERTKQEKLRIQKEIERQRIEIIKNEELRIKNEREADERDRQAFESAMEEVDEGHERERLIREEECRIEELRKERQELERIKQEELRLQREKERQEDERDRQAFESAMEEVDEGHERDFVERKEWLKALEKLDDKIDKEGFAKAMEEVDEGHEKDRLEREEECEEEKKKELLEDVLDELAFNEALAVVDEGHKKDKINREKECNNKEKNEELKKEQKQNYIKSFINNSLVFSFKKGINFENKISIDNIIIKNSVNFVTTYLMSSNGGSGRLKELFNLFPNDDKKLKNMISKGFDDYLINEINKINSDMIYNNSVIKRSYLKSLRDTTLKSIEKNSFAGFLKDNYDYIKYINYEIEKTK